MKKSYEPKGQIELCFMIKYTVALDNVETLSEVLDRLREYGDARVVDVAKTEKKRGE